MAKFLGSVRVRLTAETEDFRKGLTGATKNLQTFQKSVDKFASSMLAKTVSIAALGAGIKKSLEVAQELDRVQNALAASAKIAGQNLDTLNGIVGNAQSQFKLSKISATEYTTELANLADKAGGLKQPSEVLRAFLDIGAARGLDAAKSLEAFHNAVKLSDDGLLALFNRKPADLFNSFAASIGTTASALTEQQKAQAVVNAAMKDGEAARGSYERWLNTTEGLQFQVTQGMQDASAAIGKQFQPALVALLPAAELAANGIQMVALGIQALKADLGEIPGLMRAAGAASHGNWGLAAAEFLIAEKQWKDTMDKAKAAIAAAKIGPTGPLSGRGGNGAPPPKTDKPTKTPYNEAMERQDVLLQDAIDRAKILEAVEVSRLGVHATLNDRLDIELGLVDRLYLLQRDALLTDTRLNDAQRRVALEKLDLERQRHAWQLKQNAAVETELSTSEQIAKAAKEKQDLIVSTITGIAGSIASGGGVSGSQIGSGIGAIAGSYIPVLGTALGSGIGGFIGGLFGKKQKQDYPIVVKGMDAIERAQRDTITTIQAQTEALLKPESRLLNLPSSFTIPNYQPTSGNSVTQEVNNNVTVNLSVASAQSPDDLRETVVAAIADALSDQRRNQGW